MIQLSQLQRMREENLLILENMLRPNGPPIWAKEADAIRWAIGEIKHVRALLINRDGRIKDLTQKKQKQTCA